MTKRPSSRRWLNRHVHDEYVQQAQRDGYRSRAAYKLLEIQEKDRLLKPGQRVVDLGAAPGSWSQVATNLVGHNGYIVAIDLLPIMPLPGVTFIQGDFREPEPLAKLHQTLANARVDLVLSDLAPNITGVATVDQPRSIYLCELALDLCHTVLKPGGNLVVKVFHGTGFDEYCKQLKNVFQRVTGRKPKASRSESREVYLVARGFEVTSKTI